MVHRKKVFESAGRPSPARKRNPPHCASFTTTILRMPAAVRKRGSLRGVPLAVTILLLLAANLPPCLGLEQGEPVPDFRYTRLDGAACALSDLRGSIVVIDFFSCWWLHSRNNLVQVENLHREFGGEQVVVLGLARDGLDALKAFVEERPGDVTFTLGVSREADRKFGVGYIPHMFIIDPSGRLYWHGEPEGGPNSLFRFGLRVKYALADLVDDWPAIYHERAEAEFKEAFELALGGSTSCERAEGYLLLREVIEKHDPDKPETVTAHLGAQAAVLETMMGEAFQESITEDMHELDRLTRAAEECFRKIAEGGSLLPRERALQYVVHLRWIAEEAGPRSRLAASARGQIRSLENRLEGRAFLGVQFDTRSDREGAVIRAVINGTAAERSGLQSGDIIRAINDQEVKRADDVRRFLDGSRPGTKVLLRIQRRDRDDAISMEAILGMVPVSDLK